MLRVPNLPLSIVATDSEMVLSDTLLCPLPCFARAGRVVERKVRLSRSSMGAPGIVTIPEATTEDRRVLPAPGAPARSPDPVRRVAVRGKGAAGGHSPRRVLPAQTQSLD